MLCLLHQRYKGCQFKIEERTTVSFFHGNFFHFMQIENEAFKGEKNICEDIFFNYHMK